jgi:hypothetical protein
MKTSISSPKGQERQAYKADNLNGHFMETLNVIRKALTERVLNPNETTFNHRALILDILQAEQF